MTDDDIDAPTRRRHRGSGEWLRLHLAARRLHMAPGELASLMQSGEVPSSPASAIVWFRNIRRADVEALHNKLWPNCEQCTGAVDT